MDKIAGGRLVLTFNGPLEAGVRAVTVLGASFPNSFDLQRLIAFDYLLIRTQQLGGPNDLHPTTPIQMPATEVRRKVVQRALLLMMTRDLVRREINHDGIRFRAGESAAPFLNSIQTPYLRALQLRASWLVKYFADFNDADFNSVMRRFFDSWVEEFQNIEKSFGADA